MKNILSTVITNTLRTYLNHGYELYFGSNTSGSQSYEVGNAIFLTNDNGKTLTKIYTARSKVDFFKKEYVVTIENHVNDGGTLWNGKGEIIGTKPIYVHESGLKEIYFEDEEEYNEVVKKSRERRRRDNGDCTKVVLKEKSFPVVLKMLKNVKGHKTKKLSDIKSAYVRREYGKAKIYIEVKRPGSDITQSVMIVKN